MVANSNKKNVTKIVRQEENIIKFKPQASPATQALVLTFDLEGFSRFFSQPDVHYYVPRFLNRVFDAVSIVINGGKDYWTPNISQVKPFLIPVHQKFLGDGALYIWTFKKGIKEFKDNELKNTTFINMVWNLKKFFGNVVKACSDDVPVVDLPERIRFGVTAGSVYKLTYSQSNRNEYIGYCINLASRLQSYCRELGFIASARIGLPQKILDKYGYIKVIAKNLKGFPKEIVIVDKKEFNELSEEIKEELFDII